MSNELFIQGDILLFIIGEHLLFGLLRYFSCDFIAFGGGLVLTERLIMLVKFDDEKRLYYLSIFINYNNVDEGIRMKCNNDLA